MKTAASDVLPGAQPALQFYLLEVSPGPRRRSPGVCGACSLVSSLYPGLPHTFPAGLTVGTRELRGRSALLAASPDGAVCILHVLDMGPAERVWDT